MYTSCLTSLICHKTHGTKMCGKETLSFQTGWDPFKCKYPKLISVQTGFYVQWFSKMIQSNSSLVIHIPHRASLVVQQAELLPAMLASHIAAAVGALTALSQNPHPHLVRPRDIQGPHFILGEYSRVSTWGCTWRCEMVRVHSTE